MTLLASFAPLRLRVLIRFVGNTGFHHELFDNGNHPLGRVFHNPVAGVGEAMDFGFGKKLNEPIEKMRRETPIAHAPDQGRRQIGQTGQAAFDFQQRRVAWMPRRERDVVDKSLDRDPMSPTIVRRQSSRPSPPASSVRAERPPSGVPHGQRHSAREPPVDRTAACGKGGSAKGCAASETPPY